MPRVFFFGVDGMPPQWVLDRWLPELPTFKRLADAGCSGRIMSTVPPTSIAAWTSIFSGCDPGRHGITGYVRRPHPPSVEMGLVDATDVRVPRLWDVLTAQGKRSIVLNVPMTYPVRPFEGVMVSDFLTPGFDGPSVHPESFKKDIVDLLGHPYSFDVSEFGGYRRLTSEELVERVFAMTDEHVRLAERLLDGPWDLFVWATLGSDRLHHTLWRYLDPSHPQHERHPVFSSAILDYYKKLDGVLARMLERLTPETTVIISSDHGMATMHGRVNLNDWLLREGYLVLKDDFAAEVREGPKKLALSRVDWDRTRAFGLGAYEALLYLHPEKKDQDPAAYDALFAEIAEGIAAIPGPDGRRLETVVHRLDRLYGDAALAEAPDGVVYFDGLAMGANCDVGNNGLHSWANTVGPDDGLHAPEGTLIMSGRGVPQRDGVRCSVTDLAPTILRLLDCPVPEHMTGKDILV